MKIKILVKRGGCNFHNNNASSISLRKLTQHLSIYPLDISMNTDHE